MSDIAGAATAGPAEGDPSSAVHAVAARISVIERELAEARVALAVAETALSTVRQPALAPDAYTIDQVAHTLGMSRSKAAEMIRRGEIRSVKLGGCRRVFRDDLDEYIAGVRGQAS